MRRSDPQNLADMHAELRDRLAKSIHAPGAGFTREHGGVNLMRVPTYTMRAIPALWLILFSRPVWAQTLEELEADFKVARGMPDPAGGPILNLFTVLFIAFALLAIGAIVFLGVRDSGRARLRTVSDESEWEGEESSYFMHVVFLATGYAAIIIMLGYLPPVLSAGIGATTRWILILAAVGISVAHLLAARDEQSLPPALKYLFSGTVILAAVFFHLAFKSWAFLRFSDPFYHGPVPYVALGLIVLLVLAYSTFITWQHYRRVRR